MPPEDTHFQIEATAPIAVGKFMVSPGYWTSDLEVPGDPSFVMVPPVNQWLNSYTFGIPDTAESTKISLISTIPATTAEEISVDGVPVTAAEYTPIGTSGYGIATVDLTGTGSHHTATAPDPSILFSVEVYAQSTYSSFFHMAGYGLAPINP